MIYRLKRARTCCRERGTSQQSRQISQLRRSNANLRHDSIESPEGLTHTIRYVPLSAQAK